MYAAVSNCPDICASSFSKKCDLLVRSVKPPKLGSMKASEVFTLFDTAGYMVKTVTGSQRFSGVIIDENTTHIFTTRYRQKFDSIDSAGEYFLLSGGKYFRVIKITDINEAGKYLAFQCRERGDTSKEESHA